MKTKASIAESPTPVPNDPLRRHRNAHKALRDAFITLTDRLEPARKEIASLKAVALARADAEEDLEKLDAIFLRVKSLEHREGKATSACEAIELELQQALPAHLERDERLRAHWDAKLLGQCTATILELIDPAYRNEEALLLSVDELARKSRKYLGGQIALPQTSFAWTAPLTPASQKFASALLAGVRDPLWESPKREPIVAALKAVVQATLDAETKLFELLDGDVDVPPFEAPVPEKVDYLEFQRPLPGSPRLQPVNPYWDGLSENLNVQPPSFQGEVKEEAKWPAT
jgi:hypothetical protein